MKQARNGSIDILKFLFCLLIAVFHCYGYVSPREHWPLGSIGVEFFVLTSGMFFYRGWERERAQSTCAPALYPWKYGKKRFLRFFPFVFPATLITIFGSRFYPNLTSGRSFSAADAADWFANDLWEMVLVKLGGLNNGRSLLNGPMWTIESMLIAEVILLGILVNWETLFTTWIAPFSILFGYGYWRMLESASNRNWLGFFTFGVLHVYILMCISFYSYKLSKKLKNTDLSNFGRAIVTILEGGGYILTFLIAWFFETRYFCYLATLILALCIPVTVSGQSYLSAMCPASRFTRALGEVSFGVYVIHFPVIMFFTYFNPHETEPLPMILTMMGSIILAAVPYTMLVQTLWRSVNALCARFGDRLRTRGYQD